MGYVTMIFFVPQFHLLMYGYSDGSFFFCIFLSFSRFVSRLLFLFSTLGLFSFGNISRQVLPA